MYRRGLVCQAVVGLIVSGAAAGGLLAAAAPAAAAVEATLAVSRSTWGYTDVREPLKTFTTGEARVGAWRDDQGGYHSSKSYFTFDLPDLRGVRFFGAVAVAFETQANDCSKQFATEMWITDVVDRPTWARPPRERAKLLGLSGVPGCPARFVRWDASALVRDALAAGRPRVTLAMRMPDGKQFDPAYGRRYDNNVQILIQYNTPPSTPTDLAVSLRPCGDPLFLGDEVLDLSARFNDPDDNALLTATFAIWPVDEPARRLELTTVTNSGGRAFVRTPADLLADGVTYEWAAMARDDTDSSAWTVPCRFTVDRTPPAVEPTVSSVEYPENCPFPGCGGLGISGRFIFTANGVADVVGYNYGQFEPDNFVAADQPGGQAAVDLLPRFSGPTTLMVSSVDRAGNPGPIRVYQYYVRNTAPFVSCEPEHGSLAEPRVCTFSQGMPGVIAYRYVFDNGPALTVPANDDGTAVVTVRPTRQTGSASFVITSVTSDGIEATLNFAVSVFPSRPDITSDTFPFWDYGGKVGEPGHFTFAPHMFGVAEYVYQFDDEPVQVVPADSTGQATITYTPTSSDSHFLTVYSQTSDGVRSDEEFYWFYVNP